MHSRRHIRIIENGRVFSGKNESSSDDDCSSDDDSTSDDDSSSDSESSCGSERSDESWSSGDSVRNCFVENNTEIQGSNSCSFELIGKCVCPDLPLQICTKCKRANTHSVCLNELNETGETTDNNVEGQRHCLWCCKYSKDYIKSNANINDPGSFLRLTGEDIICQTLCDRKEYPFLTRSPYPGTDSDARVAKLHHLDCINGVCKEEACGVGSRFRDILDCPLAR